jgi:hypothetical protein
MPEYYLQWFTQQEAIKYEFVVALFSKNVYFILNYSVKRIRILPIEEPLQYLYMAIQLFVGPWTIFHFLNLLYSR